jgi:DNA-directed RNA polymerase subunit RPC12/RpoP
MRYKCIICGSEFKNMDEAVIHGLKEHNEHVNVAEEDSKRRCP